MAGSRVLAPGTIHMAKLARLAMAGHHVAIMMVETGCFVPLRCCQNMRCFRAFAREHGRGGESLKRGNGHKKPGKEEADTNHGMILSLARTARSSTFL